MFSNVLRLGVLETAQLALTFSFLFFMGNYSYQVLAHLFLPLLAWLDDLEPSMIIQSLLYSNSLQDFNYVQIYRF